MSSNGHADSRRREVFIGHDKRQALAYSVMRYSVESRASQPIAVRGLFIDQLPISRVGATAFTYSRFLVPWLMDYSGFGLFCDEDQVMTANVHELFLCCKKFEEPWEVAFVDHEQQYERPSVMVFNNKNLKHLTPEFIQDKNNRMFDFAWAEHIKFLPKEWNHLVAMDPPRDDAKLYHFTAGIPYWKETRGMPEDHHWFEAFEAMVHSGEWIDFHRDTVHFKPVMRRFLKPYGLNIGQGPDYPKLS